MTALSHTSPQAATSHIRTSRIATLAVGILAAVSGLAPAASVLLGM